MLNVGIQGASSTNCILAVWVSKPVYSGMLNAKVSSATSSATVRAPHGS